MKVIHGLCLLFCVLIGSQLSLAQNCDGVSFRNSISKVLPICNRSDGEINFRQTLDGTPPYTYSLNGNSNSSGEFSDLIASNYQVIITDALGCKDTVLVSLNPLEITENIKPYNAFTPNGDGINDTWVIPGIESYRNAIVKVFNRWGQQVHESIAYDNDLGWDGTTNGLNLPPSTYYYVISVVSNCSDQSVSGIVNIIR